MNDAPEFRRARKRAAGATRHVAATAAVVVSVVFALYAAIGALLMDCGVVGRWPYSEAWLCREGRVYLPLFQILLSLIGVSVPLAGGIATGIDGRLRWAVIGLGIAVACFVLLKATFDAQVPVLT